MSFLTPHCWHSTQLPHQSRNHTERRVLHLYNGKTTGLVKEEENKEEEEDNYVFQASVFLANDFDPHAVLQIPALDLHL